MMSLSTVVCSPVAFYDTVARRYGAVNIYPVIGNVMSQESFKPEGMPPVSPNNLERERVSAISEEVISHALQELKPFFDTYERVLLPGGKVLVNLLVNDQKQAEYVAGLLEIIGIFPWVADGEIEIDNHYEIEKLVLLGLIKDEVLVMDGEATVNETPDEYSFPLHYSEGDQLRGRRQDGGAESLTDDEEPRDVDDIFLRNEEMFRTGKDVAGNEDRPWPKDIGFLRRLGRKYRWQDGKVFDRVTGRDISEAERSGIVRAAQEGDEKALDTALRMNIGLIYFVFNNFRRFFPVDDPDNLLQEGFIQLKKCILSHRHIEGKLSSYVIPSVEGVLRKAWWEGHRAMRVPAHVAGIRRRYHRAQKFAHQMEGREAGTDARIAQVLGVPSLDEFRRQYLIGTEYLPPESIGEPDDESDDTDARMEGKPIPEALLTELDVPSRDLERSELREAVYSAIRTLTPIQQEIIILHLFDEFTLDEIGEMFDVTQERVRQIEAKALRRLRHPSVSSELRSFLDSES